MELETKRRVLMVTHPWGGGTEKNVRELIFAFQNEMDPCPFEFRIATLTDSGIHLERFTQNANIEEFFFPYSFSVSSNNVSSFKSPMDQLLRIVEVFSIDMIHFHHFVFSGDILEIVPHIAIPYVVTLHDYYSICPTVNLLNTDGNFCYACDPILDQTTEYMACMRKLKLSPEVLFLHREKFSNFFERAAAIVLPNSSMETYIRKIFERLPNLRVIEHGQMSQPSFKIEDSVNIQTASVISRDKKRLNVLLLGNITYHKGLKILAELCNDKFCKEFIKFDLLGSSHKRIPNVCYLGPYSSTDVHSLISENEYDFSLQLSITAESFSYTISELILSRIPIICFDLGAQAERVRRLNAGWVVEEISVKTLLKKIQYLFENQKEILRIKFLMKVGEISSLKKMQSEYSEVYNQLIKKYKKNIDLPDVNPNSVLEEARASLIDWKKNKNSFFKKGSPMIVQIVRLIFQGIKFCVITWNNRK